SAWRRCISKRWPWRSSGSSQARTWSWAPSSRPTLTAKYAGSVCPPTRSRPRRGNPCLTSSPPSTPSCKSTGAAASWRVAWRMGGYGLVAGNERREVGGVFDGVAREVKPVHKLAVAPSDRGSSSLLAGAAWTAEADDALPHFVLWERSHRNWNPDFPTEVVLVHGAVSRQAIKHSTFCRHCRYDLDEAHCLDRHPCLPLRNADGGHLTPSHSQSGDVGLADFVCYDSR